MRPTQFRIDSIRVAKPQREGEPPDAIVQFDISFDGPDDRIGPHLQVALPVEFDARRSVQELTDAALDALRALLGDLAATEREVLAAMLSASYRRDG